MSTDATQIMQQPNSAAPTPQPQQPVFVDTNGLINQAIEAFKPIAVQTAQQVAGDLHKESLSLIAANRQSIQDALGSIGGSFASRLTTDVWLQRALVLLVAVFALIGAALILGFDLAGSKRAADAVGWAGGLFGLALAGAVHQALGGPGAAKVPVAPVVAVPSTVTATTTTTTP